MLFFAFFYYSLAESEKNPIILLPGLYGTNLYATYSKNAKVPWYCPKSMDDELLWVGAKFLFPPLFNCLAHALQTRYNNETHTIENIPNMNITVHDFGGDSSVDYIIKNEKKFISHENEDDYNDELEQKSYRDFFKHLWQTVTKKTTKKHKHGFRFFDNYHSLIGLFVHRGYTLEKDFFVAPYDWRLAPVFSNEFYPKLKKLIEDVHDKTGKKVTLLAFSMGAFMIQQFLAAEKINEATKLMNTSRQILSSVRDPKYIVNDSWKKKFIEKVVFLDPSFSGSHKTFGAVLLKFCPFIPFVHNEHIEGMYTAIPGIYSHFANFEIFKGKEVVRGPDGINYTVEQLPELIVNYSIKKEFYPIMDYSLDAQRLAPIDIGESVPLTIIYNSNIPTLNFLDFNKGWDKFPQMYLDGKGDGTLPIEGLRYPCEHWDSKNRALICIDLNNNNTKHFKHIKLPVNPFVHELLFNYSYNDPDIEVNGWWLKKGKTEIQFNEEIYKPWEENATSSIMDKIEFL